MVFFAAGFFAAGFAAVLAAGLATNLRVVAFLTAGLRLTGVSAESATATGSTRLGLSSAAICLNIICPLSYQVCLVFCPAFEIFDLLRFENLHA